LLDFNRYLTVYAASKAFVISFSQALWAENRSYNVRILVSCPGPTETNFFTEANFPPALASSASKIASPEEVVRDSLKALERGEPIVVSGGIGSQLITRLGRFIPRKTLVSLLEKQFKAG
jgi:uncharacterized protein